MCRYQCSVLMFLLLLGITLWGYVYYLPGLSTNLQTLQAGRTGRPGPAQADKAGTVNFITETDLFPMRNVNPGVQVSSRAARVRTKSSFSSRHVLRILHKPTRVRALHAKFFKVFAFARYVLWNLTKFGQLANHEHTF